MKCWMYLKTSLTSCPAEGELKWWPNLAIWLMPYLHFWYVPMNSCSLGGSAFLFRASSAARKNEKLKGKFPKIFFRILHACMYMSYVVFETHLLGVYKLCYRRLIQSFFFLLDFWLFLSSSVHAAALSLRSCMNFSRSSNTWFRMSWRWVDMLDMFP